MSALASAKSDSKITDTLIAAALPYFAKAVWTWYDANKDRVLFSKRVLFLSFSIKVSDFEGLIAEIAGPRPAAA